MSYAYVNFNFSLQAKFYTILAKIQERSGNLEGALRTLSEAKDIRARLLKRVQLEQPESIQEQVICFIFSP